ncbi:MAG: DUF3108 domain-containing protein [Rhodobacteraceae bacterium]|nr:DUF3108 domain-containing protein [Paracoccaceae bacterium]MCZ8085063.1 DUF3108 domain-containing protein [Paracoccaceae bacterium]
MQTTARPVALASPRALALVALASLTLGLAAPLPAQAQTAQESGQFDLVMTGITAAKLDFSASQQGDAYSVTAGFTSTGLLALMRRIEFTAQAEGAIQGDLPRPTRYAAQAKAGRRSGETVMDYTDGVPQLRVDLPAREAADWQIDAATQGGTVDPISALYLTLRDVAPGAECNRRFKMFDGRRATELTVGPSRPGEGGTVTCTGEYRRIAGYPPEDMEERTRFPFTLTLMPAENGLLRVTEVEMDSLIGKARLIRR